MRWLVERHLLSKPDDLSYRALWWQERTESMCMVSHCVPSHINKTCKERRLGGPGAVLQLVEYLSSMNRALLNSSIA